MIEIRNINLPIFKFYYQILLDSILRKIKIVEIPIYLIKKKKLKKYLIYLK